MKKFNLLGLAIAIVLLAVVGAMAQPEVIIQHRINPHSQSPNRIGEALTTGGTAATTPLLYHGGPLIGTPAIYIIWYGNWNQSNGTDTPAGQQLVRDWAAGISGTPYFALNRPNSTNGYNITGNVSFTAGSNETTDGGKTRLRDSDIQNIVNNAINSGRLPYNQSGVYFVITSSDVSEQSGFCTRYCGWHTSATLSSGTVRYSFVGNAARCLNACAAQSTSPNGNAGIDAAISVLSHELEEATTDPDLNAWYDSGGSENADKCAWTFGHAQYQVNGAWANMAFGGHDWLIQRNLYYNGTDWRCMINSTQN